MRDIAALTALVLLLAGCAAWQASPEQRANASPAPASVGPDRHNVYAPWDVPSDTVTRPPKVDPHAIERLIYPKPETNGGKPVPNLEGTDDPLKPAASPDPYRRWSTGE
jgi:hypothetical protein